MAVLQKKATNVKFNQVHPELRLSAFPSVWMQNFQCSGDRRGASKYDPHHRGTG